jgi:hypothetical protein
LGALSLDAVAIPEDLAGQFIGDPEVPLGPVIASQNLFVREDEE